MTDTRFGYFDHDADIGIVGRGATVEAAFLAAAEAMFAIQVDIERVRPLNTITVDFEESNPDLALVVWLNRLLGGARSEGLALGRFQIERHGNRWTGKGWGEPWSDDLERGVEVKGATLTMLAVTRDGCEWLARCVVDV